MHLFYGYDDSDSEYKHLKQVDTLVIGGGGMKGWFFLGALSCLEDTNMVEKIKNFFGTSIGAIICLLTILNYSSKDQIEMVKDKKFFHLKNLTDIKDAFFKTDVPDILKNYISPNVTFLQLYEKTRKNYNVISFDCTLCKEIVFSHTTTPDVSVYEAVCASCAVPLLFDLVKIDTSYYTDGGVVNNLPVDHACCCKDSKNILILCIGKEDDVENHSSTELLFSPNIYNIVNLAVTVTSQKLDELRLDLCRLKWLDKELIVIKYNTKNGIHGIFYLTEKEMQEYFKIGYEKVKNIIFSKL